MQGKRNAVGSLEDSMNFDYESTSRNVGVNQQICWNNFHEPDNRDGRNETGRSIGESSSSNLQSMINHDEQTVHNGWPSSINPLGSGPRMEEQHHEPPIITSRNGFNLNLSMNQAASESNLGQLGHVGHSSSEPFGSSSRTIGFSVEEDEGRSGFPLDGGRLPCKRKSSEGNLGQSSNGGSAWPATPNYGRRDFSSINNGLELSMAATPVSPHVNHRSQRNNRARTNPSNTLLPIDPPLLRRNLRHARRSGSSAFPVSEPRDLNSRPIFMLSDEIRGDAAQLPPNWSLSGGGSWAGPSLDSHSIPSHPIASSSNVVGLPSGGGGAQRLVQSFSRSAPWGDGNHGGIFGTPRSLRGLPVGGAGRSRIVSERIHDVLNLMQRGEGIRFEDVMALDPSVLFGMADIHDRHRDMRLDVDNMSYEELLALEEQIGDVCTGVSVETIATRMKRRKFSSATTDNGAEIEPCCICQEEFSEGEDLGTLDCGHDFHSECIRRWLGQKNLCPVCKTTALST